MADNTPPTRSTAWWDQLGRSEQDAVDHHGGLADTFHDLAGQYASFTQRARSDEDWEAARHWSMKAAAAEASETHHIDMRNRAIRRRDHARKVESEVRAAAEHAATNPTLDLEGGSTDG